MRPGFFRNQSGAAAVEFGLVAPLVAAVLVGVATSGGLILAHNKMRQAVSSGAQYAMTVGADDSTAIHDVVVAAWAGMPESAEVDVSKVCLCANVAHACATNCADGDYPEKVTTISASMTYAGFGGDSHSLSTQQKVRTW